MKLSPATDARPRTSIINQPSHAAGPSLTNEGFNSPGLTWTLIIRRMHVTRVSSICPHSTSDCLTSHLQPLAEENSSKWRAYDPKEEGPERTPGPRALSYLA